MRVLRFHTLLLLLLLTWAWAGPGAAARTIEFTTTEVTQADVALSPDGQWLIFTMLGHLFRLPVAGGTAQQLTFGPYYDTDPVFSPDGSRVAFVSDRDGSEGNVFVLELATAQITQITREPWAGRSTWTPDGQAIVYLSFVRKAATSTEVPALIRRVALSGGEAEILSDSARRFGSVFYLPDGRLAWTVIEREPGSEDWTTRIEVMNPGGTVSTLRALTGRSLGVVASPLGEGLYVRRRLSLPSPAWSVPVDLLFLPLPTGAEKQVIPPKIDDFVHRRFVVSADSKSLYLGEAGRLWKVELPSGTREPIGFSARVKLDITDPIPPLKWSPAAAGSSVPPRSILSPRLSPDGRTLVFGAMGYLWQQPLDGSAQAQRLFAGSAFESEPAFSPDGQRLAFVRSQYGEDELTVFDFESGQTRTLASAEWIRKPSWSSDGERLVFEESRVEDSWRSWVVAVNRSGGNPEKLADAGNWFPRPQFSGDNKFLYFSANTTGTGTLYRMPLKENAEPAPVTQLARHLREGLVSPDGKWLAFRRNMAIWLAPLGKEPVKEEDARQLTTEGGDTFAFTPDGTAVLYAAGNRVWRHPLAGGKREAIPIRLEFQRPTPPPLLLRRVRVLDFKAGGFGRETSIFIEQGRIRWMGSEDGHQLPRETVTVDAGGRFAIPGLFDMHVHAAGANQEAFLAYGVTSVRDTGGPLTLLKALADRGEATPEPVPRYFFSGEVFEGTQPIWGDFHLQIHDGDEARAYGRRWKDWGAHFIKVYDSLPWPLQRVVAEEARRLGLPVVGHMGNVERITKSVRLGYAVLEHTTNPRPYDDVLQLLAAAGTRWDPTLSSGGFRLLLHDEPERLAEAKFKAFTGEHRIHAAMSEVRRTAAREKQLREVWVGRLAGIRASQRRGVKLQAGTDAFLGRGFFGSSLHWELEFFVQAGIPPLEVLRIATQEAAAAVGAEDDLGTLEPGKLADIVLLDKNPLEDIKNTQTIWRVIKGGWLFDPDKLRPPASTRAGE